MKPKVRPLRAEYLTPTMVMQNVFDDAGERGTKVMHLLVVAQGEDEKVQIFGTDFSLETLTAFAALLQERAGAMTRDAMWAHGAEGDEA